MTGDAGASRSVFDFFVSYKQRDSRTFVEALAVELRARGYDIWLDSDEMHPGDSILRSIENGLGMSIDTILVLSSNYFSGWSEHERRAIFSLMVAAKTRIVPIWYQIDHDDVQRLAPMLADVVGVPVASTEPLEIQAACDKISGSFKPAQRQDRLFELFLKCVANNFPEDYDIALWVAVYDNDVKALESAIKNGADVNVTDSALWNRYNRAAIKCCWPEWRKLFLHLSQTGQIGPGK